MKNRKYALIINRDDVLFTSPLKAFLEENPSIFKAIYYTDFFPPQVNKWQYIKCSFAIASPYYLLKFLLLSIKTSVLSLGLSPKKWRINNSLTALCDTYNIPCIHVKNVNEPIFLEHIQKIGVNTIISMTSQIYKSTILQQENLEFYNFHPSLLPNNKGRFPIFWAIVKRDKQGLSSHRISKKIDEGEIICQRILECQKGARVEEVMERVSAVMPDFMGEVIDLLEDGDPPVINPDYPNFYGPIPKKEDIRKYRSIIKE